MKSKEIQRNILKNTDSNPPIAISIKKIKPPNKFEGFNNIIDYL